MWTRAGLLSVAAAVATPVVLTVCWPDSQAVAAMEGQAESSQVQLVTREVVVAHLDPGGDLKSLAIDRRAIRHAMWVTREGRSQRIVVDGAPGPPFEKVSLAGFGPDGARYGYFGKREKWFTVVDGREYGPYDSILGSVPPLVFSPDGQRFAFGAIRGRTFSNVGSYFQVLDGTEHGPLGPAQLSSPVFSPDSRRVVSRIIGREGSRDVVRIVVDDASGPPFRMVGRPHFSPDSRHLAYWAGDHGSKGLQLVVDGTPVATTDKDSPEWLDALDSALTAFDLPFAPDPEHLAYVTVRDGWFVPVVNGKEGPRCQNIAEFVFSRDYRRWAYISGSETNLSKTLRGVGSVLGALSGAGAPRHRSTMRSRFVIDGVEQPDYPEPWGGPIFTADGKRVAYASEQAVVVDGVAGPIYERIAPTSLSFSPDGHRLAYAVQRKGQWRVVVDAVEGPAYSEVAFLSRDAERTALTFTPDGAHVVYIAREAGTSRVVVSPASETSRYDAVSGVVVFDTPETFAFAALRGREVLRVEVSLARSAPTR